ncbi:MAG: DUF2752 domain-containing protein [Gemmataceae bacterium]
MLLFPIGVLAIVPAPLKPKNEIRSGEPLDVLPVLGRWPRLGLVAVAVGLLLVFGVACWLDPYDGGQPLRMETHRQLGLPPCTFKVVTGYPCPSCGLTTSFALLMKGDIANSLRANAVGTLLALFWLALIPWSLASSLCGRPLGMVSIEKAVLRALIFFLTLLVLRWIIVLGMTAWSSRA